jgi:hypothetical protein
MVIQAIQAPHPNPLPAGRARGLRLFFQYQPESYDLLN